MTKDDALAELGIPEGLCDEEIIKKAYRELAQKHHPDKGGDKERFQRIQAAYAKLTGKAERGEKENALRQRALQLFQGWIEGVPDTERYHPIEQLTKAVRDVKTQLRSRISETSQGIRKRERILKRLISKKPDQRFLQECLEDDIKRHQDSIKQLEEEIGNADELIAFLQDWDYQMEGSNGEAYGSLGGYAALLGKFEYP